MLLCYLLSILLYHDCFLPVVEARLFRFALVTKGLDNPYFNISREGCQFAANIISNSSSTDDEVICDYVGPPTSMVSTPNQSGVLQSSMMKEWIMNRTYDGMAVAVSSADRLTPIINMGIDAGIPIITFDSDAPLSRRAAYIGTDIEFFGKQLAKELIQLHPNGGTYGVIASLSPNLVQRANGIRSGLSNAGNWIELSGSPSNYHGDLNLSVSQMIDFVQRNATAIVGTGADPMRTDRWMSFYDDYIRPNHIAVVCGDDLQVQMDYLSRRYVDALVGQLPYDMGALSIQTLYNLSLGRNVTNEFIGTNIITHMFVPLILPSLTVDQNLLGSLVYVGYVVFGMTALACVLAMGWTYQARNIRVVRIAQPFFLIMTATGILIMSSLLIPLSFDDGGDPHYFHETQDVVVCMLTPWLGFTGFTITFSALFTKTMRINRIFRSGTSFSKIRISITDVLPPFIFLLATNTIVLTLWTILDPLTYQRLDHTGTDGWGRVTSTYGACRSNNVWPFLAPLLVINITVLIIANVQAYLARFIQSEFAESAYIGFAMVIMLQALIMGVPILFVAKTSPQAFYLVLTFIVMILCWTTLGFIFIPKILQAIEFSKMSLEEQNLSIQSSIEISHRRSSRGSLRNTSIDQSKSFRSSVVVARKPTIVAEDVEPNDKCDGSILVMRSTNEDIEKDVVPNSSNHAQEKSLWVATRKVNFEDDEIPSDGSEIDFQNDNEAKET